jgi:chaperone required for assembly of F1-ATPase
MSAGWTPKRFWTQATTEPCDAGFTVRLDRKPVTTPLKSPVVVPTLAMAEAMAAEWRAQHDKIDPLTMPVTRAANAAIDKVIPQFHDVVEMLSAYGGTDLLCYRATGPEPLQKRQAVAWDPLLDWAATSLSAPLIVTNGVIPIEQPAESLQNLHARLAAMSAFELVAAHDLIAISGSLVLALAVMTGRVTPSQAWAAARIDEHWQAELWGADDDATQTEARKQADFLHAERFFRLCG